MIECATYNILMRVHEDVETKLLCLAEHSDGMLYPLLVIPPRPSMLYRLPGVDVSDGVVAPAAQPGKVSGSILYGEGPVDEGDVVAVEEAVGDVRRLVGGRGELGVGGAVDAVESDLAVLVVAEGPPLDAQTEGRHVCHGEV
jgi:hypothetical protein